VQLVLKCLLICSLARSLCLQILESLLTMGCAAIMGRRRRTILTGLSEAGIVLLDKPYNNCPIVPVYACQVRLHLPRRLHVDSHRKYVVSSPPIARLPPLCHSRSSQRSHCMHLLSLFSCSPLEEFFYRLRCTQPHHDRFTALFRDQPGEPVPEENFWTLWCKGRLTEADTLTIRLRATPSGLTSAHLHHPPFFTGRMPFLPLSQQCQSTVVAYYILIRFLAWSLWGGGSGILKMSALMLVNVILSS